MQQSHLIKVNQTKSNHFYIVIKKYATPPGNGFHLLFYPIFDMLPP